MERGNASTLCSCLSRVNMNKSIRPRQQRLQLPSQQKRLRVSPLTRRKVRSPTANDISSQTPTSDVVQTIISKSPRKNAFPTPKLNYEKSANLRPIILNVKEKRRAKGCSEGAATEEKEIRTDSSSAHCATTQIDINDMHSIA